MSTPVYELPRENRGWLGPLTVTVTAGGAPVDDADVAVAVKAKNSRPALADWVDPVPDPDGGDTIGFPVTPVSAAAMFGLWVRVSDATNVDVYEPDTVGYLNRT